MNCTGTINSCQHTVNTHSNINKSLKLESNLSNITLYHGSPNTQLTQLDIAKSYGSGDQYGRGLYLTTDYDEADGYAKGGRVYKVQLDDSLKFFNMEDKLPKGIVDFLYNELKDSDDDFKNSILRYARKIYKNDDMDSLEKFYDEKEEEWKSKDGYYSANKPEVDRDDKGDLIVIYTDYNDLKNSLEQLTGNMTLRAFGGDLNPQLFGNWIMSEGYDGIITHSGKWYILYKHPEKAKIVENLQKEESDFRAFKFINHKKTQVDEGNNKQELEDKYRGSEIFVDENNDISKMCESNVPKKYQHMVKDFYKTPTGTWMIDLEDGYTTSYGTNYIENKFKKDCLYELMNEVSADEVNIDIDEFKNNKPTNKEKKEEASRNELLAKTKGETISRYKRAEGYKGFNIVSIDTSDLLKGNTLVVTCRVGKYDDVVQLEDVLYWIQICAEENSTNQINTKVITKALSNSIDGMDIKVDCECGDWIYRMAYQATEWGYKYGKPETRPAKITNPNGFGALCKHLTAMLSNKKWMQQVSGTVMDWCVKNIEQINGFVQPKEGKELTLPNELARQNAKAGFYTKLFKDKLEGDSDEETELQNMDKEDNKTDSKNNINNSDANDTTINNIEKDDFKELTDVENKEDNK